MHMQCVNCLKSEGGISYQKIFHFHFGNIRSSDYCR